MSLLRARCSVCGRRVRGLPDARREGKDWFCSQSCVLQSESTSSGSGGRLRQHREGRGPVRVVRRTVKWTLIVLGLLLVAVIVLAIGGVGGTSDKHKASPRRVSHAKVLPLGSRAKPIPLGKPAAIGGGWRMRVLAVTPNANQQVLAVKRSDGGSANSPPPPGAQDFMVRLSLTYLGGGKADAGLVVDYGLHAMGVHDAKYTTGDSCGKWPEPSLQYGKELSSGHSVQGNVCFQIAANDAKTLKLYTGDPPRLKRVWFALR